MRTGLLALVVMLAAVPFGIAAAQEAPAPSAPAPTPVVQSGALQNSAAQNVQAGAVDNENVRVRTLVIFGDDPCPKATNPDEIIVCARKPEEDRYRIPKELRDQARADTIAREDDVPAGRAALVTTEAGAAGMGSCTPVGGGGIIGCTKGLDVLRGVKTVVDGAKVALEPDD